MTLLERSTVLASTLGDLKSREADKQLYESWSPLREGLPERIESLHKLVAVLRVMNKGGLLPPGSSMAPAGIPRLLSDLSKLRDKMVKSPQTVIPNNRWADAHADLKGAAKTLETNLRTRWRSYVDTLAPKLDDLLPFFRMDRADDSIHRISVLRAEIEKLPGNLPADDQTLQRARAMGDEIHQLVKKLDFGDIPPAVKKFVEQATIVGGVALHELDPAVFDWLREKHLAQSFRVGLGGGR